jgi:RNA recognition motif-containing protein
MTSLFVGNLNYNTTEADLLALFSQYGPVERVNVVTDRMTGQPRGFAFVEMTNRNEAEAAIAALNGSDLNGRTMNVNEARPKTDSFGGGGRGPGGFDRGGRPGGGSKAGGGRPGGRSRGNARW